MASCRDFPDEFLSRVFRFLDLRDLGACCSVCRKWFTLLADENCTAWKRVCEALVPDKIRKSNGLTCTAPTFKAKLRAYTHRWNPQDMSSNIYVKEDAFTLLRRPIASSTDGARTMRGFKSGRHCWEVHWPSPTGSEAVLGVATQHASMHSSGYIPLLGSGSDGWGWHLRNGTLWHGNKSQGKYPRSGTNGEAISGFKSGDRIRVILDMDQGTLAFERGSKFLGIAFDDLPTDEKLYPSFSAVYGNTEITLIYLGLPIDG